MAAPIGNQYYLLAENIGRPKKYTPKKLLRKANEYFEWVLANPFKEAQIVRGDFIETEMGTDGVKKVTKQPYILADVPKMRPFTLWGFCNFAGISVQTFDHYGNMLSKVQKEKEPDEKDLKMGREFLSVYTHVKQIINNQQFEGAASGFLNHAIIARMLGLADKKEITGNVDSNVNMVKRKIVIKKHKKGDGNNG